jgi:hypothetical protein
VGSFMPGPYPKIVLVLVAVLSLLLPDAASAANAAQQHAARKHPVKQEPPPPEAPPPPPPLPPTLEQLPAVQPKVTFNNGLLTIVAENSTLSDILRAVRTQTGAAVEMPPNATERVVTHLGPGMPREVLASLLNGSHFNYVMLGSPTNPDKVDRVILTSKSGNMPNTGSAPPPPAAAVPAEEPETQTPVDISEQPAEGAAEDSASANEDADKQPPAGQPQVKTPEQMLRELQAQQQQQQQQQQQGAAPTQPPPH